MPIYEYKCNKCSQVIEELQKFSDPPLKKCPHCGGKVNKLMSLNTFHLKGSGWYTTDYASKKGPGVTPSKSAAATEDTSTKKDDAPKSTSDSTTDS